MYSYKFLYIIIQFIVLICTSCGSYEYQWYTLPQGVSVTWSGTAHENPEAYRIWLNAEACAGHASPEPYVVYVDKNFICGQFDSIGCASPEKNIMVIDTQEIYDPVLVTYHESFHLIMNSLDEKLVGDMARECKDRFAG